VKRYSVDEILNGIRKRNDKILHHVYHENYPAVKSYVNENSGNSQDAKDIFQEGLVIIYRKVSSGELSLDCNFKTYIFSVCRLLWLKELDKRKSERMDQKDLKDYLDLQSDLNFNDIEQEKYSLYQKHLNHLDADCQKVLTLYYDGVSIRDITRIMGYSSESYTKKKKFKCKEKLIKQIKSDSNYGTISGSS
jgi:RNA polymerase sigma factor (sigma-70 family)